MGNLWLLRCSFVRFEFLIYLFIYFSLPFACKNQHRYGEYFCAIIHELSQTTIACLAIGITIVVSYPYSILMLFGGSSSVSILTDFPFHKILLYTEKNEFIIGTTAIGVWLCISKMYKTVTIEQRSSIERWEFEESYYSLKTGYLISYQIVSLPFRKISPRNVHLSPMWALASLDLDVIYS